MKRFSLTLAALTLATVVAAPATVHTTLDFDELRQENLDKDAVDFDQLRRENLDKDAALEVKGVDFDQLRRENLDKDATITDLRRDDITQE